MTRSGVCLLVHFKQLAIWLALYTKQNYKGFLLVVAFSCCCMLVQEEFVGFNYIFFCILCCAYPLDHGQEEEDGNAEMQPWSLIWFLKKEVGHHITRAKNLSQKHHSNLIYSFSFNLLSCCISGLSEKRYLIDLSFFHRSHHCFLDGLLNLIDRLQIVLLFHRHKGQYKHQSQHNNLSALSALSILYISAVIKPSVE